MVNCKVPYKVGDKMKEEKPILFLIKDLENKVFRVFLKSKHPGIAKPTPTQLQILHYLILHREKGVYQKDLENLFTLKRATISGVLQTMEKNGLIYRVSDEKDTRTKKIYVHQKTMEIFLEGKEKLTEVEQVLVKNISEKDLDHFKKTLEQMISNVDHLSKE